MAIFNFRESLNPLEGSGARQATKHLAPCPFSCPQNGLHVMTADKSLSCFGAQNHLCESTIWPVPCFSSIGLSIMTCESPDKVKKWIMKRGIGKFLGGAFTLSVIIMAANGWACAGGPTAVTNNPTLGGSRFH